jgi:hypothetical protein
VGGRNVAGAARAEPRVDAGSRREPTATNPDCADDISTSARRHDRAPRSGHRSANVYKTIVLALNREQLLNIREESQRQDTQG